MIQKPFWIRIYPTVKPVLSGHSKIDKTKILMTNGSLISILQYFWPALSKNRPWKTIFGLLFDIPLKETKSATMNIFRKKLFLFNSFVKAELN